jgi:predicted adenylyl cyclase CyaB
MRETELKGVASDEHAMRAALERARAIRAFSGMMIDRRYDTPAFDLQSRDEVLRLRIMGSGSSTRARLDYKSAASYPGGFKVRDEIGTGIEDAEVLNGILEHLGFVVTREIEREIDVYELDGASVRFERYPRLDVLVEVEGAPDAIERAIAVLGVPRATFTSERLADFVRRFEARTGQRAALCARELRGDYRYRIDDA